MHQLLTLAATCVRSGTRPRRTIFCPRKLVDAHGFSVSNTGIPSATATDNSCLSDETS
jgi:hypothetical protein